MESNSNKEIFTKAEELYNQLKEKISKYNPHADLWMLEKAYNISNVAHSLQSRASGELYVTHPLEVALILADMELDLDSIIAALLHDVVEDTIYTKQDIADLFNHSVAELVDGVTKLTKFPYHSKEEQQSENLRKMFLAMAKDIRVILIKLADRLHNMRTLKSMTTEKQKEKAQETLDIYAPLAHRLGISKIKWELEDRCLRYLHPEEYFLIKDKVNAKRKEREEHIENIKNMISSKLMAAGIAAEINGRPKHFYSIYRKMKNHNVDVDQIHDLLGIRVIVNTVADCYATLGIIHESSKPIPGRFKDYIAMPKQNLYQSLHTTVICCNGHQLEFQIRTKEMHRIAEVGIAAHWKYKENNNNDDQNLESKLEWIRQLLDIQKDAHDDSAFLDTLKIDLFEDEIFVFTPNGDVKSLPLGATPVDFAYAIHTSVGNKTIGSKVDGRIVPLNYSLESGQIVEITTSSVPHGPSRDWLKFVKTTSARKKINEWFKKEKREENIVHGKLSLERELQSHNLPLSLITKPEFLNPILEKYSAKSIEDVYALIGYGGITSIKVVARIRDEYRKTILPNEAQTYVKSTGSSKVKGHDIMVEGVDNCLIKVALCCNPVPGDEIIGFVTIGRGVSIHRKDCLNIKNLDKTHYLGGADRLIPVHWKDTIQSTYNVDVHIKANDRMNLINEISAQISSMKIDISCINAKILVDGTASMVFSVRVNDGKQLDALFNKLNQIKGVSYVSRLVQ